jgi:DNA-binding Lrp family transcriptional regulator
MISENRETDEKGENASRMFSEDEKTLLMALQYDFPLSDEPYIGISEITGLELDFVMDKTREFLQKGVIKRIGAQLNYKAFRKIGHAVLVGARVEIGEKEENIEWIAEQINSYNPKHNYLREDYFNIWFTLKAESQDKLREIVREIAEKVGFEEYVFLPSKRVYKMDVKYDLFRGVSYSLAELEADRVPPLESFGIGQELLIHLERNFPVKNKPFKEISEKFGYGEGELISLIEELIECRILRGFYAVLKERKIGFKENGMNLVKTDKPKNVALRLLKKFPEITHLVERETFGWSYPLYFMVHAVDRESIEKIRRSAEKIKGAEEVKTIYSVRDLKPNSRF